MQDNSIKNVVGGLNVCYFLPNIQRECAPQIREEVFLVGALKSFKQKFHSPKPIKTHFFNQLIF
ncbi:hypothetical protein HG558_04180 [Helicobacter pylori]|uniref:hypothetical protein n=1 Tax=Helicobacter pylori TaxID=210 RepID=UPI00192138E3|nr:hypothetical protein [Helicobacter pylori]QQW96649.1 hypothetical protein HG558_04180 [Helicobacter pylori]